MNAVEHEGGSFVVDAAVLSVAFGRPAAEIRVSMQDGRITSRCEKGHGEDAGLWRLTFYHAGRALRLTVNEDGEILKRSTFNVSAARSSIP